MFFSVFFCFFLVEGGYTATVTVTVTGSTPTTYAQGGNYQQSNQEKDASEGYEHTALRRRMA